MNTEGCLACLLFFFFFQAEDGIRDWSVTGVQTCARPICLASRRGDGRGAGTRRRSRDRGARRRGGSEERRVGKECRSRWSPYHKKKNNPFASSLGYSAACIRPKLLPLRRSKQP